jgi:hypothetical protein
MAIPPWVGPLIGVIVGFMLNLIYQYFREVRSSPVLKIDCDAAPRNIGSGNPDNVYMKFRVRNLQKRGVARNFRAYIIGIHEVRGNRVMPNDLKSDSAQLPWEGGGFEPRDIPYGHSQYADIVHFSRHESGWIFYTGPNDVARDPNIKSHRGTHQISALVAGDSAEPAIANINIDYDGDWKNAKPYDA